MTYAELLEKTEAKKKTVLKMFVNGLKDKYGFLVADEIKRDPLGVAYVYLARDFCDELEQHADEFIEQFGGVYNSYEAYEICDIIVAYEENRLADLYELLPIEAKLFEA